MAVSGSRRARSSSRCRPTSFPTISRALICRAELCRLVRAHLRFRRAHASVEPTSMRKHAPAASLILAGLAASGCGDSVSPPPAIQPSIAAGSTHTCLLSRTGTVTCWGANGSGQLGNGSNAASVSAVPVSGGIEFATIVAGAGSTCGLDRAGVAYCWGYNFNGQLGNGSTSNSTVPVPVSGNLRFTSLTAGSSHLCGVARDGAAYCWGANRFGDLGTGDTLQRLVPTLVSGALTFDALAAGSF